jgi:phospholipid transport system substrate-binding protein
MRRVLNALVLTAVLSVALAAPAWAGPSTDQVKVTVDRVIKIVQDPELKKPANTDKRRQQIREVAREIFDFEAMARGSLARHWQPLSPDQRKKFTELFTDLLEASYVGKIEAYGGEKVIYLPEKVEDDTVTVQSKIVSPRGTEIPIEYRMRKDGDRWKAFDVKVENVSLVANYRTQFNQIITRSSFDDLMKKMQQKQIEVADEQKTRKPGATKTP